MKKTTKRLISIALMISIVFTISTTAFAVNNSSLDMPQITNLQANEYREDDGTFVSQVSFYENGVFSSITKSVELDGAYTIIVEQGDYYKVDEGIYQNYEVTNAPSNLLQIASYNTRATTSWQYQYWGEEYYSVSVSRLQAYSSIATLAGAIAGFLSLGTASLAVNTAAGLFGLMASYYSTYGSNTVYFRVKRWLGMENLGTRMAYHYLTYNYAYTNSNYTNLISSATEQYEALDFYW